jgi:hypothetical protein
MSGKSVDIAIAIVLTLPGSLGRDDDFGLNLLVENPSRIEGEQRFG